MVDITEIAENIYRIDDQLYSIPEWGSIYLINEEKKALIDTGPTTSAHAALDGIRSAGVKPEDMDYLIVTHIHLDHAGGAGVLLRDMPEAQVVVHQRGARHLADPTRLVSSVIATEGEEAITRTGEVVPIENGRIKSVNDGDVIELSEKQTLRFIDAPGHAPHELCIHESRNNGLFSGDAAGISVADNKVLLPVTPPPSFDLELYLGTLDRLMGLKASMIYFAHFGGSSRVQEDLQLARDKVQLWNSIVAEAIAEGGFEKAAERIRAQIYRELEPVKKMEALYNYLTRGIAEMNVTGYINYYQKKQSAQ